jgi:hypothetical protein
MGTLAKKGSVSMVDVLCSCAVYCQPDNYILLLLLLFSLALQPSAGYGLLVHEVS